MSAENVKTESSCGLSVLGKHNSARLNVPKMLSWQEAHICSRSTLTAQTYYRKRNIQRRSKYKSFTCCSTLNTRPPKFLRPFVCNDRILSWELFTLRCTTRDPWNQRFTFSLSPALDHYYSIKRYMSEGTFVPGSPCFWRDVFWMCLFKWRLVKSLTKIISNTILLETFRF